MKIVMAIIKPFKLEEVRDALTGLGVHGLTVAPPSLEEIFLRHYGDVLPAGDPVAPVPAGAR